MKIDSTLFLQNLKDLRSFITKQNSVDKGDDEDFYIQEQLDRLHYYVKHIPRDNDNIFKAISDWLNFTIASWQHEKDFMQQTISNSLQSSSDEYNIKDLVETIGEEAMLNDAEITLLLAWYFYKRNLKLMGFDANCSLVELNLDLGFEECFIMSIIDTEKPNQNSTTIAYYDNLYSKEFINKARYWQKLVNKIVDSVIRVMEGGNASLNNTLENAASFEQDPDDDEEDPEILHTGYNRGLDHILERSDEESHEFGSDSSIQHHKYQHMNDSDQSIEEENDIDNTTDQETVDTIQKKSTFEKPKNQNQSSSSLMSTYKLNKNAPSFKPKNIKMRSNASSISETSSKNNDIQNTNQVPSYNMNYEASPVSSPQLPQSYPMQVQDYSSKFDTSAAMYSSQVQNYANMQYQMPIQQPQIQANYMISQAQNMPKLESGMLISYHSSSMMGIIQSIPSGEQVYCEIGELSRMGIGIDFLYNLARIRLMCSFSKKYVYDQSYTLRPTATNLKIISIDVNSS